MPSPLPYLSPARGNRARGSLARRLLGRCVAVGACALLAACQTGAPGGEPTPTEAVESPSAEPEETMTAEPAEEPSAEPEETAGPVVNGPNSITSPAPGETVAGPTVTVTGEGTAFEATLSYRVLVAGTEEVVVESFTMAGANGEVGPYSFEVELDPGDYTIQVWEADMSDGENEAGPFLNLVEVDITVE
ncbi:MAG: hypothetical protein JWP95_1452 [Actinotalea sp.]|nr:hypothetical protein [Actinotalea sp.]